MVPVGAGAAAIPADGLEGITLERPEDPHGTWVMPKAMVDKMQRGLRYDALAEEGFPLAVAMNYELETGRDASLRIQELRKSEWQRWVPLVGFGRLMKDGATHDGDLLAYMHSIAYTAANAVYNVACLGAVAPIVAMVKDLF